MLSSLNDNHKIDTNTQVPIEVDPVSLKVDHVCTKSMSGKYCRTLD